MSQARWFSEIKKAGKTIALGSPCRKAGHRLRSRKGHCVQCDTKVLAFAGRYDLEQYIYIAGSRRARLIKIGVCGDLLQRLRQICAERHGDAADWEILYALHLARAAEIEDVILSKLGRYSVDEYYWKNGAIQKSIEVRRCSFSQAITALKEVVGDRPSSLAINKRDTSAYEFG
ncbi:GIY-YIG nuclease family protein [Bradyrhizobium sp.]